MDGFVRADGRGGGIGDEAVSLPFAFSLVSSRRAKSAILYIGGRWSGRLLR